MSTLSVTTIQTANGSTDLTLQSGNNSAGKIVIPASGGAINASANVNITGTINASSVSVTGAANVTTINANTGVFAGLQTIDILGGSFRTGAGNYGVRIYPGGGSSATLGAIQFTNAAQNAQWGSLYFENGYGGVGTDQTWPFYIRTNGVNRVTVDGTSGAVTTTGSVISGGTVTDSTATLRPLVPMTSVALTTQATVDFTSIPSWVRKITVIFYGVSLTGGDKPLIQLGTSGGIVSSGYQSWESSGGTSTSGILYPGTTSTDTRYGLTQFALLDGVGSWVCTGLCNNNGGNIGSDQRILAIVNLGAQLTQLRLTRTGTNTFDAGFINVIYE